MCDCIEKWDESLKKYKTELNATYYIDGGTTTVRIDTLGIKGNKKPVAAIPTFCPFCGEKYNPTEEDVAQAVQDKQDLLIGRAARECSPQYFEGQELTAVMLSAARTIAGAAHRMKLNRTELSLNSGELSGEEIGNWRIIAERTTGKV